MNEQGGDPAGVHRIGDAERDAATQALVAHREAGRLDAVEFEERQVAVTRARTWAEVQPLFADLPQPHPVGMPAGGAVAASLGGVAEAPARPEGEGLLGAVVPQRYRTTVMALTPFAALALFAVTREWFWFLAIPIMGVLLYGPEGNDRQREVERRAQRERRRVERDQRRNR